MNPAGQKTKAPLISLIGLPHDANSSFLRGPAQAPPLIRQALYSPSSHLGTETGFDLGQAGVLGEAGDVEFEPGKNEWQAIERAVARVIAQGSAPLCLGGDHAVTWPVMRAVKALGQVDLLHFDAHPDLYPELDGSRTSHACPMARIKEEGLVNRLVQVGIRTVNAIQADQAHRLGVEMHLLKDGLPDRLSFDNPVWISFDLDALDPGFAPGVSHFEPGGLSTRQALDIIQGFEGRLIGADVVEFNPDRDRTGLTAMVAAKLVKELCGRILGDNGLARPGF